MVVASIIAVIGWLADLGLKEWSLRNLDPAQPPSYLGGLLRLQLLFNPGAAFSMGESFTIGLTIFAVIAFVGVVVWGFPRLRTGLHAAAAGLLLAGIAGNLTDRLFRAPGPFRGHVVDMIALPHFAVFNVADMCITGAAVLLVWMAFFARREPDHAATVDETES